MSADHSPQQELEQVSISSSIVAALNGEQSPGLGALVAQGGEWASEELRQENEEFIRSQAAGEVDEAEVEQLFLDMREGRLRLADVLGMTDGQLGAMSYRANELLRNNEPRKALSIYLALYELDPYEFKYQRGAAQCFHTIKEFGFAAGYYNLAMATLGKKDFVCMAMIAECLLWLDDKETCLRALDAALAMPMDAKEDQLYVERAQAFRQRVMALPSLK